MSISEWSPTTSLHWISDFTVATPGETYKTASCSHLGFVVSFNVAFSRGSELVPLLLLCLLFMGIAMGRPISLSVRFMARGPGLPFRGRSSLRGPSEMYSAHWNWHTTYGSMLGRSPRPSEMDTESLPLGAPTGGGVLDSRERALADEGARLDERGWPSLD
jgi:hypothetical protein